ncbi:MAG: hypothetical protein JSW59_10800 [Phycisphaerales bacterium]|nr:MAG: hypothetical protein JSW59_10800 [Phycisphaerales bacterium]
MNSSNLGKEIERAMPGVKKEQRRDGCRRIKFYCGLAARESSQVIGE